MIIKSYFFESDFGKFRVPLFCDFENFLWRNSLAPVLDGLMLECGCGCVRAGKRLIGVFPVVVQKIDF